MHIYATNCTNRRRTADRVPHKKREDVKGWKRPDGDPSVIVGKALSNIAFEKAVEYHRSSMEFISM